ncbi:MAG: molybdate ABC transporter substrate-binding protein [Nitrospinota bacterium]|nr:molybdate ABC transporter substrate-binding protein [Nitrospinota bacterium]
MKHFPVPMAGWLVALALFFSPPAQAIAAEEINVAVSSDFHLAMAIICRDFQRQSGARINISAASSGLLYAQIASGEPFDIFLSANESFPEMLEQKGLTAPGTRFTYAIGRLALFSAKKETGEINARTLSSGKFSKLALGAPSMAPYGLAGMQTLEKLGLSEKLNGRIVESGGENQAFWMVASGGAEIGFVALSRVTGLAGAKGSFWIVPQRLHSPIVQQAVLMKKSDQNAQARALLEYMKTPGAQSVMKTLGYDPAPAPPEKGPLIAVK